MSRHVLSFKPAVGPFGTHDPSAAIFEDGRLVYGVEEERLCREKHAAETFPEQSIRACLDFCNLGLSDLGRIVLPYDPKLMWRTAGYDLRSRLGRGGSVLRTLQSLERYVEQYVGAWLMPTDEVERRLRRIGEPLPPLEVRSHHGCHAASAFHYSPFDQALVVSLDGHGEFDATVVWRGDESGIERLRTYEAPNSLGYFFAAVTEYLGYRAFNGEGKVMGLAPYGERNDSIEDALRGAVRTDADYDVTEITRDGIDAGVEHLESVLDRPRSEVGETFDDWQTDLAFVAQSLLEETVVSIVERYLPEVDSSRVCLAGGVALNCKMNKQVMEHDRVDRLFVQPVAHDGGLALGGPYVDASGDAGEQMETTYWGPSYGSEEIRALLESNKIPYREPDDLPAEVADRLADGELVGWFQGRLEMGPRALGNRSILADPRTEDSRDRVNRHVKHREEWRPFAPSMLEEAAGEYLQNPEPAPYMIKTFDVVPERREEITAVLHPADDTTRPQTVRADQNPRYHRLISEFEDRTGVPVVLNTSFNDHGEPIVESPKQALKDFYGMGLDTLVIEDVLIQKQ